ncbi:MAG: DUF29 family protein [Acetobacteraceae bacterium]|nr:DUF29 family protein [Acetobacteraceae bacterium]
MIEEVQDVGLSELRACQSLLQQALVHLLKLHAWPDSPAAPHWRGNGEFPCKRPAQLHIFDAAANRPSRTLKDALYQVQSETEWDGPARQ